MKTVLLQEKYQEVSSVIREKFKLKNMFEVPRIQKVVVNVGVGKIHKESQQIEAIVDSLALITGQKPVQVVAKKAIAGFKIRQGAVVGVRVTLRGKQMWDFLNRLVHVALPRTKDFQGISVSSVDYAGNINIGIREHVIFPEIKPEKVTRMFGMQITVTTSVRNQAMGEELFRSLGFPLKK